MPRDVNGNYSLTAGQPVVTGTTISSSTHNTLMADIAAELTDSLSRAGKGAMSGVLKLVAGALGAPGLSFSSESSTGFFLNAVGDLRAAVSGNLLWQATIGEAMKLIGPGTSGATDAGLIVDTLNNITDPTTRVLSVNNHGGNVAHVTSVGAAYFGGAVRVNGAPTLTDHAVRLAEITRGGAISSSCGAYTMTGSMVGVTNLSVSVTTNGGPVLVALVPVTGTYSDVGFVADGSGIYSAYMRHMRDSTQIGEVALSATGLGASATSTQSVSLVSVDFPAAGTYTYSTQATISTGTGYVTNYRLFVRELL